MRLDEWLLSYFSTFYFWGCLPWKLAISAPKISIRSDGATMSSHRRARSPISMSGTKWKLCFISYVLIFHINVLFELDLLVWLIILGQSVLVIKKRDYVQISLTTHVKSYVYINLLSMVNYFSQIGHWNLFYLCMHRFNVTWHTILKCKTLFTNSTITAHSILSLALWWWKCVDQ